MANSSWVRTCAGRLAALAWAWAMAAVVAVAAFGTPPGPNDTANPTHTAYMTDAPWAMAAQDASQAPVAPSQAVCAVDLDADTDTADREFTSPLATALAIGPAADAVAWARPLTPQLAEPPPQRPPRLAA